jgi:hypothetical protein
MKTSIILVANRFSEHLTKTLQSIFEYQSQSEFEVLIVYRTSREITSNARAFAELLKQWPDRLHLVSAPEASTFAALIECGIKKANGNYFLFLDSATQVITHDWLEELMRLAQFPEVGAVGCKIIDSKQRLLHAGLTGAGRNIVAAPGRGLSRNNNIYFQMLNSMRETIAIPGTCLMVERTKYNQVGGIAKGCSSLLAAGIDLSLRLKAAGFISIYTPYTVVMQDRAVTNTAHHFSPTEEHTLLSRWGRELISDPFLNPNLKDDGSYEVKDFALQLEYDWNSLDPARLPISDPAKTLASSWRSLR